MQPVIRPDIRYVAGYHIYYPAFSDIRNFVESPTLKVIDGRSVKEQARISRGMTGMRQYNSFIQGRKKKLSRTMLSNYN